MQKRVGLERPILNSDINFPLCLAPMVGLSHVALRLVVREYMPANAKTIWPTEMLNSRRIPGEDLTTTPETLRETFETELVPQILGNEEKPISDSVKKLIHEWGAEGIDINMGCPVQKALKHNYGVALMGDPDYAARVVEMTVKNSTVPVSVKLRAAPQPGKKVETLTDASEIISPYANESDFSYLHNFVKGIENAGASWLCLHPRTAAQKRRGFADWSQIRNLREVTSLPLIGNGDIQTAEDAMNMLTETGCDMAMAGRALAARPWMMWQFGEMMGFEPPQGREGQRAPQGPREEGAEYGRALLQLIEYCGRYFREDLAMRKIRFYVRTTEVWLDFGQSLVGICAKAKNLQELQVLVKEFFEAPIEMCSHTELRQ
ncbi:tRNA-dihydrouridine synthase family protein [Bdellovibrio sp. HCB337]|uniref:tRNA-dihydrouridine synthase family protein n=1 Tax=Bdellovibrio sp. HCB337 TaxID=3394358 RepID=UPI0039A63206